MRRLLISLAVLGGLALCAAPEARSATPLFGATMQYVQYWHHGWHHHDWRRHEYYRHRRWACERYGRCY